MCTIATNSAVTTNATMKMLGTHTTLFNPKKETKQFSTKFNWMRRASHIFFTPKIKTWYNIKGNEVSPCLSPNRLFKLMTSANSESFAELAVCEQKGINTHAT